MNQPTNPTPTAPHKEEAKASPLSLKKLGNRDLPYTVLYIACHFANHLYYHQRWKQKYTNHTGYIIKEIQKFVQVS